MAKAIPRGWLQGALCAARPRAESRDDGGEYCHTVLYFCHNLYTELIYACLALIKGTLKVIFPK